MRIIYRILADGGFVAGDADTELTGHAYPTSVQARHARRHPVRTALEMIGAEIASRADDYDSRNWKRLKPDQHP
jgi:hypothetical protein